ncbi:MULTISPECIES: hypothetical protein [unclassified Blastococcus]
MLPRARLAALALATVAAVSGCAGTVDGTARPAAADDGAAPTGTAEPDSTQDGSAASPSAPAARPFTTVLDESPLDVLPGFVAFSAAAHPAGGYVALTGAVDGSADSTQLIRLFPPAGAQPGGRNAWQLPLLAYDADVAVTPDGTVLVLGRSSAAPAGADLVLYALRPWDDRPQTLWATSSEGGLKGGSLALSPDGATAYIGSSWFGDTPALGSSVSAVDVVSGGVDAQTVLDLGVPGVVSVEAVEARPAGGVTALVAVRGADGATGSLHVVELDEELTPVDDPVDVAPDATSTTGYGLAVTPDGAAVVALQATSAADAGYGLVVVRDGAVADSRALPSDWLPVDLAVDRTGRHAYVPLTHIGAEATLAAVDLTTGGVVSEVPLCVTSASFADVELAADGESLVATGVCDDRDWASSAFLVG